MKHVMLPSLCAVAVVASCDPVLAQQPAPVVTTTPPYLNTERGLRVKTLEGREISPSLLKGMRPEEQITKRTPGTFSPDERTRYIRQFRTTHSHVHVSEYLKSESLFSQYLYY